MKNLKKLRVVTDPQVKSVISQNSLNRVRFLSFIIAVYNNAFSLLSNFVKWRLTIKKFLGLSVRVSFTTFFLLLLGFVRGSILKLQSCNGISTFWLSDLFLVRFIPYFEYFSQVCFLKHYESLKNTIEVWNKITEWFSQFIIIKWLKVVKSNILAVLAILANFGRKN